MYFVAALLSDVIEFKNCNNNSHQITSINTSSINEYQGSHISMTIPLELLKVFENGSIRIVSSVYNNISMIFSDDIGKK